VWRTTLGAVLERALDYALEQLKSREGIADDLWSQRAAVYAEIISRLSVRLSGTEALALFRRGLLCGKDPRWKSRELREPLANLLERSLSSVPPSVRATLVTEMLSFPLPDEAGIHSDLARGWPEPAAWLPTPLIPRPIHDAEFAARVSALIGKVASGDAGNRERAARRLTGLYMGGTLNSTEAELFGRALWSRRTSQIDLPADTSLYSYMFLLLPSPDKAAARALFMSHSHEPTSYDYFVSLALAAQKQRDGSRGLVLTREEALKLLKGILSWQPKKAPELDLANVRGENRISRQTIGAAMADAILPPLSSNDLSPELIEGCFSLVEANTAPSVSLALPELVRIQPSLLERATNLILRMMASREAEENSAGFHTAYRWAVMAKDGTVPELPRRIVDSITYMVEARREPGLLPALRNSLQLLKEGMLTQLDRDRLAASLELILIETDYAKQTPNETETIAITLVRAAAVRLADCLRRAGMSDDCLSKLLSSAEQDSMPEVRFAAAGDEE
jgi:hypothetical protein